MGWLERVGRVVKGHLNSLVHEAEDPEKLLDEAINKMEQELIAMRRALAEAIATHKSAERQLSRYEKAAATWYERAELAMAKGGESLAREALFKRQSYKQQADSIESQLIEQNEIIEKLKNELRTIEHKEREAKAKKSLYLARLRSAIASQKLHEVLGDFDPYNSDNLFDRIDQQILELEAQSTTMGKMPDPLESKFNELENNKKVEQEMAKLKEKNSQTEIDELRSKIDKL
ncbi:PspA/IM30 family protein [Crocosphaera sp.]|uniref:PspA/IM30 family protein n=1 Tax=Crocosphaera sp. TaxID=2729996 RepID=UPI00262B60D1|nr:PspA/IM30 family protein [Crocosphaera sp.]MDJ0580042.1 PspA/IM30 family protein [Crocosphaera sp.]